MHWTLALAVAGLVALLALGPGKSAAVPAPPPNILLIVSDDQPIGTTDNPDPNCQSGSPRPSYCKATQIPSCMVANPAPSCYTWMPNLVDWFKTNGTKFGQGVDTTPLCCPSRSSILTGRYAHNHGVITNDLGRVIFSDPANQKTMLQYYLKKAQYKTAIFGKFLNDWVTDGADAPNGKGAPPNFDEYAIYDNGRHLGTSTTATDCSASGPKGMACVLQNEQGSSAPAPRGAINEYETTFLAKKVQDFIATAPQPWFLVVTPTVPHANFEPDPASPYADPHFLTPPPPEPGSPGYFETDDKTFGKCTTAPCPAFSGKPSYTKYGNCGGKTAHAGTWPAGDPTVIPAPPAPEYDPDDPVNGDGYKQCVLGHRDLMFRMLKSMDDLVGSIRTSIDPAAVLAFYISDNGYMWGQHWLQGKPYPYTESVRVPFFMSGPGVAKNVQGGDSRRMVANVDIAPTVMKAAGLPKATNRLNAPMDGKDLLDPSFVRNYILLERPGRLPPWNNPAVLPPGPGCHHSTDPEGVGVACATPTASNPPLWASIRTLSPALGESSDLFGATRPYQYVETYASSAAPFNSDRSSPAYGKIYIRAGMDPAWWEFYDLAGQPYEVKNSYGGDLAYGGGDDELNAPNPAVLHDQIGKLESCQGHGEVPNPNTPGTNYPACP
jgi:arylsulfatase A-like enzyme